MSEALIAEQLSHYIRFTYPQVIFHWDFGSGLKMTMGQAAKQRRLNDRGFPDLFIAEPRHGRCGLFIELKKDGVRIKLRDGSMTADRHIREQAAVIDRLKALGYGAAFAVGFDEARHVIDSYLKQA